MDATKLVGIVGIIAVMCGALFIYDSQTDSVAWQDAAYYLVITAMAGLGLYFYINRRW